MKKFVIMAILSNLLLCSCNRTEVNNPGNESESEGNGVKTPRQLSFSSVDEQLLYRTNEFSFNLLSSVSNEEDKPNVILSPLSASMMLGMVMNGATDETLAQMQKALGFEGLSQDDINAYYKQLVETLPALDTVTRVKIANSIWIDKAFPVKQEYVDVNRQSFNAAAGNVDMHDEATADAINQWASDNTNNLINKVVSPSDIYDCVMILANALYFKGVWEDEFDEADTRERPFNLIGGGRKNVSMMHRTDRFAYAETEAGQLLELPYKGGQYCMDILLPAEGSSIKEVLSQLTVEKWNGYLAQTFHPEVNLALPKFKLKYNRTLTDDLRAIGIQRALSPAAQFPLISDIPTYLALVKQFCYLAVDEKGTEAAAVTIGEVGCTSAGPDPIIDFIADRPFLAVIREKKYGTILFTALIGDPTEE